VRDCANELVSMDVSRLSLMLSFGLHEINIMGKKTKIELKYAFIMSR
jgi:hypothetical protein